MTDPVVLTNLAGGVSTRQQLIVGGCSGTDITRAVRLGELRRVRQGRYVTPMASLEAIVAARVGGLLAGPSAARSYGLWGGLDTRVHLSVDSAASRLRTRVAPSLVPAGEHPQADLIGLQLKLHWIRGGGVPELGPECWRVPLRRCLMQVIAWCDRETALACLDTVVGVLGMSPQELTSMMSDAPVAVRALVAEARAGSQSGTESITRQRLTALGLQLAQQFWVRGVGHVDLHVVGSRVMIEIDSSFHDSPEAQAEDARRDRELVAQGYVVVRLRYEDVMFAWESCVERVFAALGTDSSMSVYEPEF